MYVFAIEPADLSTHAAAAAWDTLDFRGQIDSARGGTVSWQLTAPGPIFGFALWWECTLAPGIVLSTSPYAPRTHWDQIYLPLLEPLATVAGDELFLQVTSETGGPESGIDVRWTVRQARAGHSIEQALSIGRGWLG